MRLDVTVEAREMIDALVDAYGDDYDTLAEFIKACSSYRDLEVKSDADWYDVMSEISDDQIKAEYEERCLSDGGDENDIAAGVHELAAGNALVARALFDRAGREDLSSAI